MKTAILHYSVPPVIGGVEFVIEAHATQFVEAGLPIKIITGRGEKNYFPKEVEFECIAELDSLHPEIAAATVELNIGKIPDTFESLVKRITEKLRPKFRDIDHVIVHNVLTKHFNLPLTAALFRLMDEDIIRNMVAWCHDLSWTSSNSRNKVFPGYPWQLLKTVQKNTSYIAVSKKRQDEIIESFGLQADQVPIIPNGVNSNVLLALSDEGSDLINRLDLRSADLILFMPVRITEAKNIEFAMRVTEALCKLRIFTKLIISGPPDPHDEGNKAYFESLKMLRKQLQMEQNVHFVYEAGQDTSTGYLISQHIVAELYRVADALFLTSHREGFGMPILEAGLLGLPIITTNVPAVQDLQLQDVLIILENIDPNELAKKIINWINKKPEHHLKVAVRQNLTWKALFENQILPLLTAGEII